MHCLNQLAIEAENQRQSGENIRDCDEICDALGSQSSARTSADRSGWGALILIDLAGRRRLAQTLGAGNTTVSYDALAFVLVFQT
jgi:hypothetical protein